MDGMVRTSVFWSGILAALLFCHGCATKVFTLSDLMVHLGDNNTEYVHDFILEEVPYNARLEIVCSDVAPSNWSYDNWVYLNDKMIYRLNNSFDSQSRLRKTVRIPVENSLLKKGKNQLIITSGYSTKRYEYDDFNIFAISLLADGY